MTTSYLSFRKSQSQPGCEGGRRWAGQDWQSGAGRVISAAAPSCERVRAPRGSATTKRCELATGTVPVLLPVRGLVFGSTACGGSREVGILLAQAASSSAQRQWRSLGARSMLDARSLMISTLRSQVSFATGVAHARLRLSGRYASAARAFISPTAFEQARGGALGAGGGRVGFAGGGLFMGLF